MSKYKSDEAPPLELGLYTHINPIIAPFLYEKLGLTPNGITTITLFFWDFTQYTAYTLATIKPQPLFMYSDRY